MVQRQSLEGSWLWRRAGESAYHHGTVCGSVLSDMLAEGLIDDPYWRDNEYKTRELFTSDYVYEKQFVLTSEDISSSGIALVFEGLDTLADIRLNGECVGFSNDMHRCYRFPVKHMLVVGENRLEVTLKSPLNFIRDEDSKNDIAYASTGCLHGNAALRKAHYMFGWDWGPQLPDAGIFRPVYLEFTDGPRIDDLKHSQRHADGQVWLKVICSLADRPGSGTLTLAITLISPDGIKESYVHPVDAEMTQVDAELNVLNPQLWWPNGWGDHPLYTVVVSLQENEQVLDERRMRIGLRSIALCTAPDEWGSEFAFLVNGKRIFAMGANMIPQDNILPRVTAERTRQLVMDCAAANFNMLRVWGGGYYPDDCFYDLCDEHGILVWQDLMFGCNIYALDDQGVFEKNIVAETQDNVRRLRHHACLAVWCGNNEMEWGWAEWARLAGHHPRYKRDYLIIFERILSDVVKACDGLTPWWPSSPSSGGSFFIPSDPNHGDQHYWEVWHSGKPFTEYRKFHFRFCSEYGFQSFPSIKTIRSFTLPEDRNIFSRVMESHQKNGLANSKIFTYVADYFRYPKNMDAIAYISQLLQLKAIQYGVEFWRQNRGRCMGSLYWQLNDCWPVASWSSLDYYGRWKALHYGARRFYAPLMASACEKEELSSQITYYMHNDSLAEQVCVLTVTLADADFHVLQVLKKEESVPPLSAVPVLFADFEPYLGDPYVRRRTFASYSMATGGREVSRGVTLFVKPKHFEFPKTEYTIDVIKAEECFDIRVRASGFSHYTELALTDCDAVFSDNYFDITGPQGVCVSVPKAALMEEMTVEEIKHRLQVRSVRDTYEGEED